MPFEGDSVVGPPGDPAGNAHLGPANRRALVVATGVRRHGRGIPWRLAALLRVAAAGWSGRPGRGRSRRGARHRAGQSLHQQHAHAAGPDDRDLGPAEDRLTGGSEEKGLPVEAGGDDRFAVVWLRRQDVQSGSDDDGPGQLDTVSVGEPDVPGDGPLG